MNGKGDKRRPMQISQEEFAKRWEMAFGKSNDYNELKIGDKFQLFCDHHGCKRTLTLIMDNPSIGRAYHKKYGSIDLRNQIWYCYQHKNDS